MRAANPHRGELTARLITSDLPGGKDYLLRPDFEALATVEDETGCAVKEMASKVDRGSLPMVRALLREMLIAGGTPADNALVVDMINHTGMQALIDTPGGYLIQGLIGFITGGRPVKAPKGEPKRRSRKRSTSASTPD